MAGVDLPNQFPNSKMAAAVKAGQSRFQSQDTPSLAVGGQDNVAIATATTLTVPAGATTAIITAVGGAAYWTIDGTLPSATNYNGTVASGSSITLSGALLSALKIQGTNMSVAYMK